MADIPTTEPTQIRAGETIQWTREDLSDYPASAGWALSYTIINTSNKYTVNAIADGDFFDVTITATISAGYTAGFYTLMGRVSKAGEVVNVYTKSIEILPDLAAAATYEIRTDAKRILDAIDATILGTATIEQLDLISKTFRDRNIQRNPELLMKYREIYKKEVAAQKIAAGLCGPRRIGVRLTRI